MNTNELRQKDQEALRIELHALLKEQFNLRMQVGSGQTARPHRIKEVRRSIARVKTIVREKARESKGASS